MQQATVDPRIDKKEQAKSLKQILDYTDVGDYNKAVKYCNMSKFGYTWMKCGRVDEELESAVLQGHEGLLLG